MQFPHVNGWRPSRNSWRPRIDDTFSSSASALKLGGSPRDAAGSATPRSSATSRALARATRTRGVVGAEASATLRPLCRASAMGAAAARRSLRRALSARAVSARRSLRRALAAGATAARRSLRRALAAGATAARRSLWRALASGATAARRSLRRALAAGATAARRSLRRALAAWATAARRSLWRALASGATAARRSLRRALAAGATAARRSLRRALMAGAAAARRALCAASDLPRVHAGHSSGEAMGAGRGPPHPLQVGAKPESPPPRLPRARRASSERRCAALASRCALSQTLSPRTWAASIAVASTAPVGEARGTAAAVARASAAVEGARRTAAPLARASAAAVGARRTAAPMARVSAAGCQSRAIAARQQQKNKIKMTNAQAAHVSCGHTMIFQKKVKTLKTQKKRKRKWTRSKKKDPGESISGSTPDNLSAPARERLRKLPERRATREAETRERPSARELP